MKRTLIVAACFAMGILVATSFAAAQETAATTGGQVTVALLKTPSVDSSKFQEYRDIPNGLTIPYLNLFSKTAGLDFNLTALNVGRRDQRYSGWANLSFMALSFDYNQTPHNIGNNAHSLWSEQSPGVWTMNPMVRQNWGAALEAVGSSARTWDFYMGMVSPAWNSMNVVDIRGDRKRAEFGADFSQKLPFDLKFTYMRELKTGNRAESMGGIYGVASAVVDVPDYMNEVTTDFGVTAAYNFKKLGNVHASFSRSVYNDKATSLVIDNPFRAVDAAYVSTGNGFGGPAQGRFGVPPDNEASRFAVGFLIKLPRMTRISGDYALGTWTQNDQYLPYTINSTIQTTALAAANDIASLPQQSLNGKINTTMLNFAASSRPIAGLGIRLRYRSFDQANKTPFIIWPGTAGASPDRAWAAGGTATSYATSTIYSYKNARFDAQASYDFGKLVSLEAAYHNTKYDRVGVEATGGKDVGSAFSAVFHVADWLGLRAMYDTSHQTAVYDPLTVGNGLPTNETERKRTKTGFDLELSPVNGLELTLAYFRRNDTYPNRPSRVVGGDPQVFGNGLWGASYDTYTAELDYSPSEKVELGAFYTYEKNLTNIKSTSSNGSNVWIYDGNDKTNSFGAHAIFHFVPEKWSVSVNFVNQKVDGILGALIVNTWGSNYIGRSTLTPPGAQPITDWDDTLITTINAQLDWNVTKAWKLSAGYMYEKYTYADAETSGTLPMPIHPLNFLKPNSGSYTAGVSYLKLGYKF